jgi:hypothetical protein
MMHYRRTRTRLHVCVVIAAFAVLVGLSPIQKSKAQPEMGGWRFVRLPSTPDTTSAVAIMHAPELSSSDLNFAGLMFRCSKNNMQVMIALVEPFPPRSQTQVTIASGARETKLTGTVIGPGLAILLPPEATVLAETAWRSLDRISIVVEKDDTKLKGAVALTGLPAALQKLRENCLFD